MATEFIRPARRGPRSPHLSRRSPAKAEPAARWTPRAVPITFRVSRNTPRAVPITHCGSRRPSAGFSLIEILVTVGLLTFIILGLLMMFNQTQRAFRTGMTQADILEGGRAAMDFLVRDIEDLTPSQAPDIVNPSAHVLNCFAEVDPFFKNPLQQALPGTEPPRVNIIQRFFFLSRVNQDWLGTGYFVLKDDPNIAVGSLYRLCVTNTPRHRPPTLGEEFRTFLESRSLQQIQASPAVHRIADGVVHLRVRAYDTNGVAVTPPGPLGPAQPAVLRNATWAWNGFIKDQVDYSFWSNAVPAYLELELGVLEPQILKRYRAMAPGSPAQTDYISNRVANVHIFRQRIPVRNVDFSAYQ